MSESPDVSALRAEVDALRARNAKLEQDRASSMPRRATRAARGVVALLLIVIGVLCLTVMPVAIWGRNLVLSTDRYVDTLRPVASEPGVQDAVIRVVSTRVSARLDVDAVLGDALPPRAADRLGPVLQGAVESLVDNVTTRFVRSDAFEDLWVEINRAAHRQINYVLTGELPDDAVLKVSDNNRVILDLSSVVERVKGRLVAAGLTVAKNVPAAGATIEIADLHGLDRAQDATRRLDQVANWTPVVGLVLVGCGIALSRRRLRSLTGAALGLAAGMVLLGIGLLIARGVYLNRIPPDTLTRDAAESAFDTMVRYLRWGIRLLLVLTLLVAFGGWYVGPSRSAAAARRLATSVPQSIGNRLHTGSIGGFISQHATGLRVGVIAIGCVVLIMLDAPSVVVVIVLASLVAVLLLLLELLRAGPA